MNKKLLMVLLLSTFVLYLGCNLTRVSSAPSNSATASSGEGNSSVNNLVDNKIISFSIGDRSASINKNNITVLVPIGTDLTNLVPNITVSNNSSLTPASGVAQNFTSPVVYIVTAEDGSTKSYTVTAALLSTGYKASFSSNGVTFNLAYVPGGLSYPSMYEFPETVQNAYWIGETVVTYELWSTVYTWATANGYTFGHPGLNGSKGTGDVTQPVTTVSWRDAMVFSNAITEWSNATNGTNYTCVYYTDAAYTTPIRTSTNNSACGTLGCEDSPYVNTTANGFRLLKFPEWELAARYIGTIAPHVLPLATEVSTTDVNGVTYYWTPGNYASGATGSAITGWDDNIGNWAVNPDTAPTQAVSWYRTNSNSQTHAVAQLNPNGLGLYDMTGNVNQWLDESMNCLMQGGGCVPSGARIVKGGTWNNDIFFLQIDSAQFNGFNSFAAYSSFGFRLARTD